MATITPTEHAATESHSHAQPAAASGGLHVLARMPDVSAPRPSGWRRAAGKLGRALPDRRGIVIGISVGLALAALLSLRDHRRRASQASPPPSAVSSSPVETTLPPLTGPEPSFDTSARLEGTVETPYTASHTNAAPQSSVR